MGRQLVRKWRKQGSDGRFVRKRKIWDGTNWNDGYKDNKGRFRVYRPDYPRAYNEGYCLRTHVVWWLANGEPHPIGTNLHHRNGKKDDDRLENLEIYEHGSHTTHHCKLPDVFFVCEGCGKKFKVLKRKYNRKYCTLNCYHENKRR